MTSLFSTKYFQSDLWRWSRLEFAVIFSKKEIVKSIVEIKILSMSVYQLEVSAPNSTSLLVPLRCFLLFNIIMHILNFLSSLLLPLLLKFTHFINLF